MTALRRAAGITVAEFQQWIPAEGHDLRWQLIDGTPVAIAPASENRSRIQAETAFLLTAHLRQHRPHCAVLVTPGVVPQTRSNNNERIPDLGVTCRPSSGGPVLEAPLLLVEILSPSNEAITRANVLAYMTIPDVAEILLLSSTSIAAEVLRRVPGAEWQQKPKFVTDGEDVILYSIEFRTRLRDFYRTTSLV